jgi:peptidoglycan lytic transglycosylase G
VSVRSGRGPRDEGKPVKPGMPAWRASDGRGGPPRVSRSRGPEPRRFRVPGVLRFLLFGGVLAVAVLVILLTAARPLVRAGVVAWAWDNPSWITRVSFVGDLVRDDLGDSLNAKASGDATAAVFEVLPNDTVLAIGPRLKAQGFVLNDRAFMYLALTSNLQPKLQAGDFLLRRDMTPSDVVIALVRARVQLTTINVTFREGIRLEQQTALLETVTSGVDPQAFYDLAKHPTDTLLADYPWLTAAGLPKGASLEGFLYPATYTLVTATSGGPFHVTTAEDLIRAELDKFYQAIGPARMLVPVDRGLNFFQIVTLASVVQHETARADEKALVAGVYQNRLDRLNGFAPLMGSEPTVIWALDTVKLGKLPIEQWKDYFFWDAIKTVIKDIQVPKALQGYQTYQVTGLIPGPISTPTEIDIDAALHPDQKDGFLYFLALPNSDKNVFAHTLAEHNANIKQYYPNGF